MIRHFRFRPWLAAVAALGLLAACRDEPPPAAPPPVTVMTFNVENLFDNRDDPGKDDHTYLPLEAKQSGAHREKCAAIEVERWRDQCLHWDWSDALVERKLEVVAAAILQVNDGRGPDIVALQEVENLRILERLRSEYLEAADYREPVLIEGNDSRGIDVAFLSRLPLAGVPGLHEIRFGDAMLEREGDTRGILEATFELPDGSLLTGFAVHFPAPYHPTEMRFAAYERLNELKAALPPDRAVFAAGDFNTTSAEDREQDLLGRLVRPGWTVAHELGCGTDCRGTSYYARDGSWSFLDMILWSPAKRGAGATWGIRSGSVRLANSGPGQRREDATPARFEAQTGSGVSDHWPLVVTLEKHENQ